MLNYADRLAEVLLPAFTVRMWRPGLMTFVAVAAAVADRNRRPHRVKDALRLGLMTTRYRSANSRERSRQGSTVQGRSRSGMRACTGARAMLPRALQVGHSGSR
jgi:hypothetical protein